MNQTIHIIAGPTASGKSALAILRARDQDGEIINADSRQIYDALPILSAQPSQDDLAAAPHHLYGVLDPNDSCSAGRWRGLAKETIEDVLSRGRTPIICGGTGLYIKALTEGLSPIPSVPKHIRQRAADLQKELGNPGFYEHLKKHDPKTAALYHPMHTARLIHAWEILEATGTPLADWQAMPKEEPPSGWVFDITLVMPPRDVLYKRCNDRFLQMLEMGAADELSAFDEKVGRGEINPDAIIIKTLGAEPLRQWRRGTLSKDDAITLAQTETRHYAKRQVTWFKNQVKPRTNILHIRSPA